MDQQFRLNDIGIKIFHPPIQLNRRLYLDLIERLADYYNTHATYPDKFSFSATRQKMVTITQNMCSVTEVFDDELNIVKNRLFKTINNIVVAAQLTNIDYFDLVASVVYSPKLSKEDSYSFEKIDHIGNSFLKKLDFQGLGAQDFTTGIHWFFKKNRRNYTLKVEPFSGHPSDIFIDLIVLFPQESVSIAEIKMLVEEELTYLNGEIYKFVSSQMELKS